MLKASVAVILYLVSGSSGGILHGNKDDAYGSNVTTLYPINATTDDIRSKITLNDTKINANETLDSADSVSAEVNNEEIEISSNVSHDEENNLYFNKDNEDDKTYDDIKETEIHPSTKQSTPKDKKQVELKKEVSAWTIDTSYSPNKFFYNNTNKIENRTVATKLKDFKPSPLLGTFYEENAFVIPTQATATPFAPVIKKPHTLTSVSKDYYKLNYKKPIDVPYPFERNVYSKTKNWKETLESKPTVEVPVHIPAGGLYKSPYLLGEKPHLEGYGQGFGNFEDVKEITVKERSNPWKSLLNLATALLPIGLIISALTPNVVTLQTTENNPYYSTRITRYSESSITDLPTISERCKRRLLCEIHSDRNYLRYENSPSAGFKYCYKLPCEDPQAMNKMLQWLITHHRYGSYQQVTNNEGDYKNR